MELYIPPSSNGRACETWKNDIPKVQKCTDNLSFPVIFHIKNKKRYTKSTKVYWQSVFSCDLPYQKSNNAVPRINPYIKKKDPNRKKLE